MHLLKVKLLLVFLDLYQNVVMGKGTFTYFNMQAEFWVFCYTKAAKTGEIGSERGRERERCVRARVHVCVLIEY